MSPAAAAPFRSRIVGSGEVAPADIVVNPLNWRVHPREQRGALSGSLETVGWVQQVIVNQRTGQLVDGHARVELALLNNQATIPVIYVDLDPEEEALVLATLDPIAAMATTDKGKLEGLLAGMTVDHAGLARLLGALGGDPGGARQTDPDAVPELVATPWVKPGQMYALGDHRVLCGDATDGAAYDRLLGEQRIAAVFTDPPWNVAIGKDTNPRHRQREGLINDDLNEVDFIRLLAGFAGQVVPRLDGDMYCVLGAAEWPTLDLALRGAGLHWSATIIWVKDLFVLGRSKYHRRYEPIWYGWPEKGTSSFAGSRSLDDVWEIPRPRRSEQHPTMKPVALVEQAIRNSSAIDDLILDPFLGSGTTILAAETTGRRGYGIELDPRYAQVSIERWQAFTGRTAELVHG